MHVIGPELGASQPGTTIVCGDSHTSTHGAFGALAFGIGTTEVGHVLATQCLLQRKPKTLAINVDGKLAPGVTAKDVILRVIGEIGVGGGTGHVIEYRGSAIRAMSMEERMTVCNMSIEAGARAGMIAPDDTTYQYLAGRPLAPQGAAWDAAVKRWRSLPSDAGARFDRELNIDVSRLAPMVTFGTNPGMVIPIDDEVPRGDDPSFRKALAYMQVEAGKPLLGQAGRRRVHRLVHERPAQRPPRWPRACSAAGTSRNACACSSCRARTRSSARPRPKGSIEIVRAAGGEWREPGCSMCIAMNGDKVASGQLSVSTSNRNFEGRQGSGARTVLASPLTAAAAAIKGAIADPRELMG